MSPVLLLAQSVYVHDFGTTAITSHPYTVAPGTLNTNLSNSSWSNSTGAWTSFAGSSGQAISLSNSGGTPTITLTFSVAACNDLTISSYSFWRQRSTTGAQNWNITINGNAVGSGTVPTSGSNTGNVTTGLPLIVNGNVSVVISLSGASGAGTFRLDDFTLNGVVTNTCCVSVTEPTIQASASTASDIGCNAGKISWTNGNGIGRIVVMQAASPPGSPVDGTVYTADNDFGNGSSIGAAFVVGSGTSNSVFVFGLAASTTYHWSVYEYNGGGSCIDYTATGHNGSFTTTTCSDPLGITAIYIDACPGGCSYEGNNEIIFGQTGSYGIEVNNNGPVIQYGSASPPTITYISTYTSNAANLATLNLAAACGSTVFADPYSQGYIPPNSKFMLANNCMCSPSAYDFSGFCGQTIYTVFGTNASWPCNSGGGIFGNSNGCTLPISLRYTEVDFNNWGINTIPIYDYDICQLSAIGNGDYVLFDPAGGSAIAYGNNNCEVPLLVLPVQLVSFQVEKKHKTAELEWITAAEKDLANIEVLRSADAFYFETLAQVYPTNSETGSQYSFTDTEPLEGLNYYRLKFTDHSGKVFTSQIELEDFATGNESIYYNDSEEALYLNMDEGDRELSFALFDLTGRTILEIPLQGATRLNLKAIGLNTGIFVAKIMSPHGVKTVKKIIVY